MARGGKDIDGFDGTNIDSLPRWLRDFIDLNNENAGRDTGRTKRFLAADAYDGLSAEERKEKERYADALSRLLQDPAYARQYERAWEAVSDASDATERALRKLTQAWNESTAHLGAVRQSAAQLPDGTKVFKSKDGRLHAEDGSDVTDKKSSVTGLTDTSPSWEDFQEAKTTAKDLEKRLGEVEDYQRHYVEPAKQRLSDTKNPPSKDELQDIFTTLKTDAPKDVQAERSSTASAPVNSAAADEYGLEAKMNAPDVRAQFKTAHDPYGSSAAPLPTIKPIPV